MAEVALPGRSRHSRQASSISNIMSGNVAVTEPKFEMVPNPSFSFPMQPKGPSSSNLQTGPAPSRRRPMSMHLGVPGAQPGSTGGAHRRTTSALPSFSFNADNTSGLQETPSEPMVDVASPALTPRRGHRRGGSEFVGGDSRLGLTNALSTSPTRTTAAEPATLEPSNALPVPGPSGKRGHAHRRSAALSSHDVLSIMLPTEETPPRMSTSLPNTPLGHPGESSTPVLDRSVSFSNAEFGSRDSSPSRPGSRPRVGFSENVEIIPRPLSTISSEGSFSMSRNHSVNNSITSVISMGSPPPRISRRSLSAGNMNSIIEQSPRKRSSVEISKRVEREGAWLKSPGSPAAESEVSPHTLSFADPGRNEQPKVAHRSRRSLGRDLGFDRRKSEPSISSCANEESTLSTVSLQDDNTDSTMDMDVLDSRVDRRSSTRRLKEWAASKLHRRSRDFNKSYPTPLSIPRTGSVRPKSDGFFDVPGQVPMSSSNNDFSEPAAAETDLDAVFGGSGDAADETDACSASESRVQFNTPTFTQPSTFRPVDDDSAQVIDLDDAISLQTPPLGSTHRKQLHSAARSNNMPNGYLHRRTESAPVMMPFDFSRTGTPQSSMADVFEEEEEDDQLGSKSGRPHTSHGLSRDETAGIGISIVDADSPALNFGAEDAAHTGRNDWEQERPSSSLGYTSMSSHLNTPLNERRGSSIIEETIMEEVSPVEAQAAGIHIVADHEEPRAPSLTKSSDSSETPTLLASQREGMFYPAMAAPMMTPETYQTSTFSSSSPGRPPSFDTPRLGTSASSINDNRTVSSCTTGEQPQEVRVSTDDIPSLTSSRSTMFSTAHANSSHRDFSGASAGYVGQRNSSGASSTLDPTMIAERRHKRSSIQSLSQLMGNSFGPKAKASEEFRPQTSSAATVSTFKAPKKEHKLKKLMFWRSKQSDAEGSRSLSVNRPGSKAG